MQPMQLLEGSSTVSVLEYMHCKQQHWSHDTHCKRRAWVVEDSKYCKGSKGASVLRVVPPAYTQCAFMSVSMYSLCHLHCPVERSTVQNTPMS